MTVMGMKKFKRILSILSTALLAAAFAGCGTYTPPDNPDDPDKPGTPVVNPDPVNPAEDVFKVSLVWNGNPFTQSNYAGLTGIQAQWTEIVASGQPQVYRASFDKDGVAKSPDPDGDFRVTLVNLPDGYTYEPNIYEANNDFKEVTISLYKITPLSARLKAPSVEDTYYYRLNNIGAYRVKLENENDKVFFQFMPSVNGKYTVTSMVDVTANEINPKLDLYFGNPQYIAPTAAKKQDDGGSENSYTKNFKMEYTISPDEVGNVMWFRLYSTCRNDSENAYPLTVDFILDRDGDFANRYDAAEEIKPTENFDTVSGSILNPAGTFTYCANRPGVENKKLDQRSVKLYDDGYYYYYVHDSITGNDTQLERVYAQLRKRTEVMDESFYGGSHVTLYYLVGADGVAKNYEEFIRGANGYGAHCNGDGVYPVTEELKEFLQTYSVCQRFFNDGNGWAETEANYNSDEDSQWMFACGYYAT